ncbi:MAG: agmatine deiminase family protein [Myxococcota bacterium]
MGAPAREGWRWPAEWEPHAATWLAWPHNPETWPGRLEHAQDAFAVFVRELAAREPVQLLVNNVETELAARVLLGSEGVDVERVGFHRVRTNDSWLRDSGPLFLVREDETALADFGFDAWGQKYPPWDLDDAVPRAIQEITGLPRFEAGFVLEGGSVEGDGGGTILTTDSCLLNRNREPGRSREQMERRLSEWLGAREVVWLADGIQGDDTDGHIDDIARFVGPGTVVAVTAEEGHPDQAVLAENLARLRAARDADGKPLAIAKLPSPPPLELAGIRCPASYANFLLVNGAVLLPTFGAPQDQRARAVLGELLPERDVVPVPARELVLGLGALHCLSQQQPASG